jgi:hypothetical protein
VSKHTIQLNGFHIEIGWDRPMRGAFCVVQSDAQVTSLSDEYVYCNLSDPEAVERGIAYFLNVLAGLGVVLPERMVKWLHEDARENAMNRTVRWNADGSNNRDNAIT